jgi:hypothetical protein
LTLLSSALFVASGLALFAGCGSTGSPHLTSADAATLRGDLTAAGTAAAARDRRGALDDLLRFAARVQRLRVAGRLAGGDANALALGAARARGAELRELPPAVTAVAPAPATLSPPPPHRPHEPKQKDHHGKRGEKRGDGAGGD